METVYSILERFASGELSIYDTIERLEYRYSELYLMDELLEKFAASALEGILAVSPQYLIEEFAKGTAGGIQATAAINLAKIMVQKVRGQSVE